jgi:hypothetical protein
MALGWPPAEAILSPRGGGPSIFAQLCQAKIGRTLELELGRDRLGGIRVGVLARTPDRDDTEPPLAIVCEFGRTADSEALQRVHQLAWNFSRSPLLITLEPTLIRAWTCYEAPQRSVGDQFEGSRAEIVAARGEVLPTGNIGGAARSALDWLELATGSFYRKNAKRFPLDGRADRTLLRNLQIARTELTRDLDVDIVHDLLARIIFIQFLFQRKDSSGTAALNPDRLRRLQRSGILRHRYESLEEILRDHVDTYRFFQWLDERFNGDLFPGKAQTEEASLHEWSFEREAVKQKHLELLADFVGGSFTFADGQTSLWPLYSFDTIPLEFISSVYEEFVHASGKATGAHYTPGYLVDFLLDSVLPWNEDRWDLRILDPACGSGIFLVKAFQRLVHRWKRAHPNETVRASDLRGLLERNIVGTDLDPHAARVASFSLYLAMCDELDPKDYWTQVRFPVLRNVTIHARDFFDELVEGTRTLEDRGSYDIVVGNAPWGHKSISGSAAAEWAYSQGWPVSNKDVGSLFLAKATALTLPGGLVAMLQPAGVLLHRFRTAAEFRARLFATYQVEEIVNFSALRFGLFKAAVAPVCSFVLRNSPPTGQPIIYICPKPGAPDDDQHGLVIDDHDLQYVWPDEAAEEPAIWTTLMWGGRRDLALIRELRQHPTLRTLSDTGFVHAGAGVEWGGLSHETLNGRHVLANPTFPEETFLWLDPSKLPVIEELRTHRTTDPLIFNAPQIVIKKAYTSQVARLQAAIVPESSGDGVVCSQSYVSASTASENVGILEAACLAYNSVIALYYLFLTSGRLATYRPEPLVNEILSVPIPALQKDLLRGLTSSAEIDRRAFEAFHLDEARQILIEDSLDVTFADFKDIGHASGYSPTIREGERELLQYCKEFLNVLAAAFGEKSRGSATIFAELAGSENLPVRLVAISLDHSSKPGGIDIVTLDDELLRTRLRSILTDQSGTVSGLGPIGVTFQRIARIYTVMQTPQGRAPVVFLVKPDRRRYWTRSRAMHDADVVIRDSGFWRGNDLSGAHDAKSSANFPPSPTPALT